MAIGFEDGTIHILSNTLSDMTSWRLDTVIDKGYVIIFSLFFLELVLTLRLGSSALLMTVKYTG